MSFVNPEAWAVASAAWALLEAVNDRRVKQAEKRLAKDAATIFRRQGKAFLAKFASLKGEFAEAVRKGDSWEGYWDDVADDTSPELTRAIAKAHRAAMKAGADATVAAAQVSIAFDLKSPEAVDYLGKKAAERVSGINDETRDQLRTTITNGRANGSSWSDIAKEIKGRFDGFSEPGRGSGSRSRAEFVAITEVRDAYNQGRLQQARQMADVGLEMEKSWDATGGDTCDECLGNVEDGWIGVDELFSSGDDAPLAHPNCLCGLLTRLKRDRDDEATGTDTKVDDED